MQRIHVEMVALILTTVVLVSGAAADDRDLNTSSMQSSAQLVSADNLIGIDVLDSQGKKIGKVDDLLLDSQGVAVTHAVVARGGLLGLGAKRHAVPWQELQLSGVDYALSPDGTEVIDDDGAVVVNGSKEHFAQISPPLDNDAWSEYEPQGRASRRVTDILGSEVNGRNDDAIGEVEDLVIDADRGRVAYALVDYEGAWDLEADALSVPWPAMTRTNAAVETSLDESAARQLGYHRGDFSRLGNAAYRNRLYGATGSRGYWDERTGASNVDSWNRDAVDDNERLGESQGAQTGNKGELITIAGTVESVSGGSAPDKEDAHAGVLTFRLKPETGATVTIDAGSKAALDQRKLTLSKGDKVTVTGYRMAAAKTDQTGAEGAAAKGEHIMATTIQKGSQTVQIERGQSHPHK